MTKKASVLNFGCVTSKNDSAQLQNFLICNGWKIISDFRKADLIFFRACAFLEESEEISLNIIRNIKSEKKQKGKFIVWGCLPKINPEKLKQEYVGVTFGEREIEIINNIIKTNKPIQEIKAYYLIDNFNYTSQEKKMFKKTIKKIINMLIEYPSKMNSCTYPEKSIFYIKVATGCLGFCTYCIIRKARGIIQSKNINKILEEFREGLNRGYKYFSLLATDIGAYGRDHGENLVDLLCEMTKESGRYKIALRNLNPYHLIEMFEKLKPYFSSGKIWFISIPVESGSNRILKLMKRRYKIEDFLECIRTLNLEYPNIILRTQIIVGFPTETEQDFQQSMQLLDKLVFDWVDIFKYSKRPGTIAFKMDSQISKKIQNIRYLRLFVKVLIQYPIKKILKKIRACTR